MLEKEWRCCVKTSGCFLPRRRDITRQQDQLVYLSAGEHVILSKGLRFALSKHKESQCLMRPQRVLIARLICKYPQSDRSESHVVAATIQSYLFKQGLIGHQ